MEWTLPEAGRITDLMRHCRLWDKHLQLFRRSACPTPDNKQSSAVESTVTHPKNANDVIISAAKDSMMVPTVEQKACVSQAGWWLLFWCE